MGFFWSRYILTLKKKLVIKFQSAPVYVKIVFHLISSSCPTIMVTVPWLPGLSQWNRFPLSHFLKDVSQWGWLIRISRLETAECIWVHYDTPGSAMTVEQIRPVSECIVSLYDLDSVSGVPQGPQTLPNQLWIVVSIQVFKWQVLWRNICVIGPFDIGGVWIYIRHAQILYL